MEQIMGQIHIWQMGVDLCLIAAILVFTFRWIKGDRTQALLPRTMELESSLRSLIVEADGAGRQLNDQLLRREQGLHKILEDISAADQKIQREIVSSEERTQALQREADKAKSVISELQGVLREFREQLAGESMKEQEAPREVATSVPTASPAATMRSEHSLPSAAPVSRQVYRENMGHQELQQVYAAAESMLKQGQELSQVSAQTRLPVEEVRLLSQMIEVEREELGRKKTASAQPAAQTDNRLGALGAIRRHNATL